MGCTSVLSGRRRDDNTALKMDWKWLALTMMIMMLALVEGSVQTANHSLRRIARDIFAITTAGLLVVGTERYIDRDQTPPPVQVNRAQWHELHQSMDGMRNELSALRRQNQRLERHVVELTDEVKSTRQAFNNKPRFRQR